MSITIYEHKPSVKFEKVGNPTNVYGYKSCKSFRTYIEQQLRNSRSNNEIIAEAILTGVLEAYNHFNPIKQTEVEVSSWKGESSFELIKGIDRLTIIKYQKKDKESKPLEIKTEVNREELISLINSLNTLKNRLITRDYLETKEIAFEYCLNLNIKEDPQGRELLNQDFWTLFFGWRSMHNKFTLMLSSLEKLGLISYNAGKIRLLKNKLDIQMIL